MRLLKTELAFFGTLILSSACLPPPARPVFKSGDQSGLEANPDPVEEETPTEEGGGTGEEEPSDPSETPSGENGEGENEKETGKGNEPDPVVKTPDPKTPDPVTPTPTPMPKPEDEVKDPGTAGNGKFTLNKDSISVDPRTEKKNGVPEGKVTEFTMSSKDSKIFQGKDSYLKEKGDFTRKGWVYVPADYKGEELPFIFIGDGGWGQHKLFIPTLNNLIAEKKIPKMALILLEPGPLGGGDGPGSQRSWEYDSVNDAYARFVDTEVLPVAEKTGNVKFTKNPEGRATAGGSSSGAMAFTMAWFRPDLFRRVITYSGTFVFRHKEQVPLGAYEYHNRLIKEADKKPIRVTLQVGSRDNNFDMYNNWMTANEAMFNVMKEKGYNVRYHWVDNAGHIDMKVYQATLAENLIWLWAGYPIK